MEPAQLLSPEPAPPNGHRVVMTTLQPTLSVTALPNTAGLSSSPVYGNENGNRSSFADRKILQQQYQRGVGDDWPQSPIVEDDIRIMRTIGDVSRTRQQQQTRKAKSRPDITRQASAFFEDAFQSTREVIPVEDRVRGESMITAEVKTNVIISDEYIFITDLSYLLSNRYRRPITSIAVFVHHGACMLFGGNFEPSYIMTVTGLQCHIQTSLNKRNAALVQKHMEERLQVPPNRGTLRFVGIPEENLAFGGRTAAGGIADSPSNCFSDHQNGTSSMPAGGGVSKSRSKGRLNVKASVLSLFRRSRSVPRPPKRRSIQRSDEMKATGSVNAPRSKGSPSSIPSPTNIPASRLQLTLLQGSVEQQQTPTTPEPSRFSRRLGAQNVTVGSWNGPVPGRSPRHIRGQSQGQGHKQSQRPPRERGSSQQQGLTGKQVEKKQAVSEPVEKADAGRQTPVAEVEDKKRKSHKKSFISRVFGRTPRVVDVIPPS